MPGGIANGNEEFTVGLREEIIVITADLGCRFLERGDV